MKNVPVSLSIVASVLTGFALAADPRAEVEKTFDRHKGGLCDRILKIKFAPQEAAITITKPIDFFPAA